MSKNKLISKSKDALENIINLSEKIIFAELPFSNIYASYIAGDAYDNLMKEYWKELHPNKNKTTYTGKILGTIRGLFFETITIAGPAYLIANNELDATIAIGTAAIIRQFSFHRANYYTEDRLTEGKMLHERLEKKNYSKNSIKRMIKRTRGLARRYYKPDWKQWIPLTGIIENYSDKYQGKPHVTQESGVKSAFWKTYQGASLISALTVPAFYGFEFLNDLTDKVQQYLNSKL